jgi:hypothetical protein
MGCNCAIINIHHLPHISVGVKAIIILGSPINCGNQSADAACALQALRKIRAQIFTRNFRRYAVLNPGLPITIHAFLKSKKHCTKFKQGSIFIIGKLLHDLFKFRLIGFYHFFQIHVVPLF